MTVKFLFSLILGGSGFLLWFWFCKCLKKQFVWEGTWKKESRAFLFWVAFFVRFRIDPSQVVASIWYFLFELKEKREKKNIFIFFNWVALASFCVLKIDFLFMLEHSTSFNNRLVSDSFFSFSFRLRLVLFRICTKWNKKRNSIFCFMERGKKWCTFVSLKLSCQIEGYH